jgi:hypothetical protein
MAKAILEKRHDGLVFKIPESITILYSLDAGIVFDIKAQERNGHLLINMITPLQD